MTEAELHGLVTRDCLVGTGGAQEARREVIDAAQDAVKGGV